jgi:hypothetical protein
MAGKAFEIQNCNHFRDQSNQDNIGKLSLLRGKKYKQEEEITD